MILTAFLYCIHWEPILVKSVMNSLLLRAITYHYVAKFPPSPAIGLGRWRARIHLPPYDISEIGSKRNSTTTAITTTFHRPLNRRLRRPSDLTSQCVAFYCNTPRASIHFLVESGFPSMQLFCPACFMAGSRLPLWLSLAHPSSLCFSSM